MSILRLIIVFVFALAFAGCDDPGVSRTDAAPGRDASYVDGSGLLDAGAARDSAPEIDATGIRACESEPCDPVLPGDGCGEDSCVLWAESSSCGVAGMMGPGADCESPMDCAPGLACFRHEGGYGVCGRICCPSQDGCLEGALCGGAGILVDGTTTPWGECLPPRSCDVLRPELVCESREGCYIVDSSGATECRVAGAAGVGDVCELQEDCEAGLFCGGVGNLRCVRICRVGGEDCPTDEGRCVAQAHSPDGTGFCTIDTSTPRY